MMLKGSLKVLLYVFLLSFCLVIYLIFKTSAKISNTQNTVLQKEKLLGVTDGFSSNLGSYQQYFRTFVVSPSEITENKIQQHQHNADSILQDIVQIMPPDTNVTHIVVKLQKNYRAERQFISSQVASIKRKESLTLNAVNESELRMDYVWTDLFALREMLKSSILVDHQFTLSVAQDAGMFAVIAMLMLAGVAILFIIASYQRKHKKNIILAEKRAVQEREILMKALLDNTTTNMYIIDKQGLILYANKAFESFVGLQSDQIIGKHFDDLQIKKEIVFEKTGLRNSADPDYIETEETITLNGEINYYFTRKFPVKNEDGDVFASAMIYRNITERILNEEGLKKSREEAEHARLTQEQFMANISHEIRTPMNGIMGMTDLLNGTNLDTEQRDYLETIQQSSKNLMVLINDILDFSKIEAGMLELESIPFKINDVVDQVFDAIAPKANHKHLTLSKQIDHRVPLHVMGDSLRLYQILANILSNAVKFTEKGAVELNITASCHNSPFLKVVFKIKDSGIGIPEDRIGYIFQSFAQTSIDISRKFGGTGLGLAIVKQLVDMHDGSISVESTLGTGSCFTIEIPFISHTDATWTSKDSEKFMLLKERKVLVVEDNLINQKVIVRTLDNVGIVSTVCDNGFKALEVLETATFDVIIMDIQMPEIDGRETAIRIRKQLNLKVPIIAMTASVSADEREKCKQAGMEDYISKPFVKEDLFEKLLLHI
ncbi:MAG: PAS domain-containing hybrid sensor histidine kinase/response regulator [Pedobacter sp.]|nr:MAG: PAS domain-containing hybrid sensor histidine kinase/response regulator [Pedobacter sp.]